MPRELRDRLQKCATNMIFCDNRFRFLQQYNEKKLEQFVDLLELFVCKRCWSQTKENGFPSRPYHHHGGLQYWLSRFKRVNKNCFYKWVLDTEHGLLHGLLVAFFALQVADMDDRIIEQIDSYNDQQRPYYADQLLMSCLFHDYVKVIEDINEEHDKRLTEYIDGLLPDTYTHAKPVSVTPLVAGDRFELMRYPDADKWVNRDMIDTSIYPESFLGHFFRHIRPALEDIFAHRYEVWLSHCPEYTEGFDNADHYPARHWLAVDEGFEPLNDSDQYMSVNSGRLTHRCLNHRPEELRGFISSSMLKKAGCKIVNCPEQCMYGRDHLYIYEQQKISLDQWVFLYDSSEDFDIIDNDKCKFIKRSLVYRLLDITENFIGRAELFLTD